MCYEIYSCYLISLAFRKGDFVISCLALLISAPFEITHETTDSRLDRGNIIFSLKERIWL